MVCISFAFPFYSQQLFAFIDHLDYLYQPILNYFVPKSLAPNIISILGLISCLIALFVHYLDMFGRYEYLIVAFFLFLYQLFDSLDGMQARRTKSSSALGELVDHGIDAFTSGLIIVIISRQCGMSQTQQLLLIVECYIVFYMNHFIGYFEGKLEFGYILNPTEALCVLVLFEISATIFNLTTTTFQSTKVMAIPLNNIIVLILTFFTIINISIIFIKLRNHSNLLVTMYPFLIIIVTSIFIMANKSNSTIINQLKIFTGILLMTHYNQLFIAHYILQIPRPSIEYLYSTFTFLSLFYLVNITNYNLITGNLTGVDSFATVIVIILGFSFALLSELSLIVNVFTVFSKILRIHPFKV